MAPSYKLTYFNLRARAEPARLIFAFAKIPYEDNRVKSEDWPTLKSTTTWGSLPILEVDGKKLGQSMAIARYLGNQFKLAGDNDFEKGQCDEMVEALADLGNAVKPAIVESDAEKKKEIAGKLIVDTFPKFLVKFNEILQKNGGFFVGKRISYADLTIASFLEIYNEKFGGGLFKEYPALQAHQQLVFNSPGVKEWVEKRPKTSM